MSLLAWIQCRVSIEKEKRQFAGAGGSTNLEEILEGFKRWVEI
ncbi:hypothetical protein J7Q84_17730 [Bacillus sp. 165]|nr:hypothetical protein [Bacillus sp. 165]